MSNFKVGDRVEFIEEDWGIEKGEQHKISFMDETSALGLKVADNMCWHYFKNIKLIPDTITITKWAELNGKKNENYRLSVDGSSADIFKQDESYIGAFYYEEIPQETMLTTLKAFGFDIQFKALPTFTDTETHCLKMLKGLGYKYISRDKAGQIYASKDLPRREQKYWISEEMWAIANSLFPTITWETDCAVIDELLEAI